MSEHNFLAQNTLFPVPIETLWSLLARAAARGLWQPSVNSAELLLGEEATQGCEMALDTDDTVSSSIVIERVLFCTTPTRLQTVRHYPNFDCFSDYQLTAKSQQLCQLQLHRMLRASTHVSPSNEDFHELVDLLKPKREMDALKAVIDDLLKRLSTTPN